MTGGPQYCPGGIDRRRVVDNLDPSAGVTEIDGILTDAQGGEFRHWFSVQPQGSIGELVSSATWNEFLHHHIAGADLFAGLGKGGFQGLPIFGADDLGAGDRSIAAAHVGLENDGKQHVKRIDISG